MTRHASQCPGVRRLRGFLLLICLATSSTATTEVIDKLSYTSYEVDASGARSLANLLDKASPHRHGDAVYYGYTKWRIGWKVRWRYGPDRRCKLTEVNTELSGSIDLPALTGASDRQAGKFEVFLAALRVHEEGHYAIGREAAKAVDAALLALPEMVDCDTLQAAVTATGNETMSSFKDRGAQYDLETQHGKTQGAWLND